MSPKRQYRLSGSTFIQVYFHFGPCLGLGGVWAKVGTPSPLAIAPQFATHRFQIDYLMMIGYLIHIKSLIDFFQITNDLQEAIALIAGHIL